MTTLLLLLFGIAIGVAFATVFSLLALIQKPKRERRNLFLPPPAPKLTHDPEQYRREREAYHRMLGPKPPNGQPHP